MGALASLLRQNLGTLLSRESQWLPLVEAASLRYGVEPALIMAIISVESSFDPQAVNSTDPSFGLMQVLLQTAQGLTGNPSLAPDDLLDPALNIDLGTRYLRQQIDRYGGDDAQAISAYNAGTATTQNARYVAQVLAERERFRRELGPGQSGPNAGTVDVVLKTTAPPPPVSDSLPWVLIGVGTLGIIVVTVVLMRTR